MERCPNCRARYEAGNHCRRCGMDLSLLLAVERAAESMTAEAVSQLAAGEIPDAVRTLARARGLSAEPLITHVLGFARDLASSL
jgi:hypothetical protein